MKKVYRFSDRGSVAVFDQETGVRGKAESEGGRCALLSICTMKLYFIAIKTCLPYIAQLFPALLCVALPQTVSLAHYALHSDTSIAPAEVQPGKQCKVHTSCTSCSCTIHVASQINCKLYFFALWEQLGFMMAKLREVVHSKYETYFDAFLIFLTHPLWHDFHCLEQGT